MKLSASKRNLGMKMVICGICFLFCCINLTSATTITHLRSIRISDGDIPTWTAGDSWTYTINPLSFTSPNGSFDGSINNFEQTVVGKSDDTYTISISGDISGDVDVNGFQGELTGIITGESQIRVSDLAQLSTEIHSSGEITYMWIPFAYTMDLYMSSSPALEVYDFPLQIEEWQLNGITTVAGSFSIEGIVTQSFEGNQWIDETVACITQEPLTVPAGTFDCYKIGRETAMSWFSTQVGNMVKTTVDQSDENMTVHLVATLQTYTRVNQPLTVTMDLSPSIVIPGASVLVSGDAVVTSSGDPVQNGAILIEIPSVGWSWTITTDSQGQYTMTFVAPTLTDDTACGREIGSDGVLVTCTSGGLSGYRVQTLTTIQDTAPETPSIQGPTEGKPKISYEYTFMAVDPENDQVMYFIDWGDGTNSSWVGPYESNENVTLSHTFAKKGGYTVKVQAQDIYAAVSQWGSLQVTMPSAVSVFLTEWLSHFPLLSHFLHQFFGE
jgi:hypothetical protein